MDGRFPIQNPKPPIIGSEWVPLFLCGDTACNSVGVHVFSKKYDVFTFFSVYLEIGAADTDQGALEFTFDGGNDNGRQFEVKVTQILCNSASRYCLKLLNTACCRILKFIYSEKATKFCKIFTLLLTGTT